MLLLVLDLLGVAVFALSGALAAVNAKLNVFGVVVLAMVTSIGGGVLRDLLIGNTPSTVRQWPIFVVQIVVALIVFRWHPPVSRLRNGVQLADAFGLALFVTTGTLTALAAGAPIATAGMVGVLSGIGGGMVRDVLLHETPTVLRHHFYAVAAAAGAVIVIVGTKLGFPQVAVAVVGAVVILVLRLYDLWRESKAEAAPAHST